MFERGMTTQKISESATALQKNFVKTKLQEDMQNIYAYYMLSNKREVDGDSVSSDSGHGMHFFVAVACAEDGEERVAGCVGILRSTYPANDKYIYDESRDIGPSSVLELVGLWVCVFV